MRRDTCFVLTCRVRAPSVACPRHPTHPRPAQAFLGAFVTGGLGIHLPFGEAFSDPNWFTASYTFATKNPAGTAQILILLSIIEGQSFANEFYTGGGSREPGNLGFDPLGFCKNKPAKDVETMQLKELKNGRLAMIGWAAMISGHFMPASVPFPVG